MAECSKSEDNVDARRIHEDSSPRATQALELAGSLESEDYKMDYENRGKCYIFNHKVFHSRLKLSERLGTDVDAENLSHRFRNLGFETTVFNDLTSEEVEKKLEEAAKEDHKDSSCFVCCILTHGHLGLLFAQDYFYYIEDVIARFRGDVCPSLVGKPKLFFIQACQGDRIQPAVNTICKDSADSPHQFKMPTHADVLVSYSTVPGYYSWRNETEGSWFVQALCAALDEHAKTKDILQILTIVNRKVAFEFEGYRSDDIVLHRTKQMPYITSTLTRNLKFF